MPQDTCEEIKKRSYTLGPGMTECTITKRRPSGTVVTEYIRRFLGNERRIVTKRFPDGSVLKEYPGMIVKESGDGRVRTVTYTNSPVPLSSRDAKIQAYGLLVVLMLLALGLAVLGRAGF